MMRIDDFLGGKVKLKQSLKGLRATSDSVLLASSIPAKEGETVLDVGTGNGVVSLCLNARVKGLKLTGLDCQEPLLKLAQENAQINQAQFEGVLGEVPQKNKFLYGRQFHHVTTNPPFYDEDKRRKSPEVAKAYQEEVPLKDWIDFCLKYVRAKGTFTIIHRTEKLSEILSSISSKLGAIEIFPIISKKGEPAKRIIVRGVMNSKTPLRLWNPLIMHTTLDKRTPTAEKLLRQGLSIDDI